MGGSGKNFISLDSSYPTWSMQLSSQHRLTKLVILFFMIVFSVVVVLEILEDDVRRRENNIFLVSRESSVSLVP